MSQAFFDDSGESTPSAVGGCVATDAAWALFDGEWRQVLADYNVAWPESNGKVARSHRTDEEEFYRSTTFRSVAELTVKLRRWEHEYNHRRPYLALAGKTPAERLCELRIRRGPVQVMA